MSFFARLGTLLRANINDLISRAEDPEKILNQLILDMREQMTEAKKQVAQAIADEKRLHKQLENQETDAREWERKAMLAVRAGRDDLAVEALNRKNQADALVDEYRKQWQMHKQATDKLRGALLQLQNKIDEAGRKKELLIARQRRAEAQKRIQETMRGFGDTSAFDAFERMSKKVDAMEAEAEAQAELNEELTGGDLRDRFRDLEADHGANEALSALKAKMGLAPPVAAPAPAPETTAVEEEFDFEELERQLAGVSTAKN
jgi:phage shock protein A